MPLHHDQTVSAVVLDCAFHSGLDGELLRGEELFSTDLSINDPTVDISFGSGISDGHRLKVMILLEIGIDVGFPIQLTDDEIEIKMFVGRNILNQKRTRDFASFDQRLEHRKHV